MLFIASSQSLSSSLPVQQQTSTEQDIGVPIVHVAVVGQFFRDLGNALDEIMGDSSGGSDSGSEGTRDAVPSDTRETSPTTPPTPTPFPMYGLTRDQNREIQELLTKLGYEPGVVDGLPGAKTRSAIAQYQSDQGLPVTGVPSVELLGLMQAAVTAASTVVPNVIINEKRVTPSEPAQDATGLETSAPSLEIKGLVSSPIGNNPVAPTAVFFDPTYPASFSPAAQHLGVDLPAAEGSAVVSPVTGTVLLNRTDKTDPFEKYLLILDSVSGFEHVLGHIDSSLEAGAEVTAGETQVGMIVKAGTGAHVHWGINERSVLRAIGDGWGWGRAPVTANIEQASAKGWIDPSSFLSTKMNNDELADELPQRVPTDVAVSDDRLVESTTSSSTQEDSANGMQGAIQPEGGNSKVGMTTDDNQKFIGVWTSNRRYCADISKSHVANDYRLALWECESEVTAAAKFSLVGYDSGLESQDKQITVKLISDNDIDLEFSAIAREKLPSDLRKTGDSSFKRDRGVPADLLYPFAPEAPFFSFGDRMELTNDQNCTIGWRGAREAKSFTWTGHCDNSGQPSGSGTLTVRGPYQELILRLRIGQGTELKWVNDEIYWNADLKVEYKIQPPRRYSALGRYANVIAYIPKDINLHWPATIEKINLLAMLYYFRNSAAVGDRETASGIWVSTVYESDRAKQHAPTQTDYRMGWNFKRIEPQWSDNKAMSYYSDELKKAQEAVAVQKQRHAEEEQKTRIAALRSAAEKKWKESWESELASEDPWENITDLMRFNKAATIASLSKGHLIKLEYKSTNVEFREGRSVLKDFQRGTDIYEGIPQGGFSWEKWFDATSGSASASRSFTVYCSMAPELLVGLGDGEKHVFYGTLTSVMDSDYRSDVYLNCVKPDQKGLAQNDASTSQGHENSGQAIEASGERHSSDNQTQPAVAPSVENLIFRGDEFGSPIMVQLPDDLSESAELNYRKKIGNTWLPPIPPTYGAMSRLDPDLKAALCALDMIKVITVPGMKGIGAKTLSYFRYTDGAPKNRLLTLAERKLSSVSYRDCYDANLQGPSKRNVCTLEFTYTLESDIEGVEYQDESALGEAAASEVPNEGKWVVENVRLNDPDNGVLLKALARSLGDKARSSCVLN